MSVDRMYMAAYALFVMQSACNISGSELALQDLNLRLPPVVLGGMAVREVTGGL